jgi:hypothetical protein
MKKVYIGENPFDAHMVRDFLESAGIEAVVRGEHLFALRGGVPMTDDTLPAVWLVYEEKFEEARKLVEQLQARSQFRVVEGSDETPAESEGSREGRDAETSA